MDDLYWSYFEIPVIGFLFLTRLINRFFEAGLFGMGNISIKALAVKSQEKAPALAEFLGSHLNYQTVIRTYDKLGLIVLFAVCLVAWKLPLWQLLLIFVVYNVLFDQALPNYLAFRSPEVFVSRLYPIMRPFYSLILPLTFPIVHFSKLGKSNDENGEDDDENPEEISAFIQTGRDEGIIEEKERTLLQNILAFNDTVVREIMTPRTEMKCIEMSMKYEEVAQQFHDTKFSRLAVYKDDIDHIEGIMRYKDLADFKISPDDMRPFIREVLHVPENMDISDLLPNMLKKRLQMAIVLDEYGGTAGLITLEDLIEEIVGEIHDEHEETVFDEIHDLQNGSFLVQGRMLLKDFSQYFQVTVENEDVDTIAGLIFNLNGSIPKEGDQFPLAGLAVEVAKADDRRIFELKVTPPPAPAPEPVEEKA